MKVESRNQDDLKNRLKSSDKKVFWKCIKYINGFRAQTCEITSEKWIEHYSQLFNKSYRGSSVLSIIEPTIQNQPNLTIMYSDFILDRPLTLLEMSIAIKSMRNNKSPGKDGIPTEIYKLYLHDEGLSNILLKFFNCILVILCA